MKGPVCVYSSGDTEAKTKSLAESIGVATTSAKSEHCEPNTVVKKENEISSENRTYSADNSGSCTMVSEEMAKFAVTSVQSQSTECFSGNVKTANADAMLTDKKSVASSATEGQSGAGSGSIDLENPTRDSRRDAAAELTMEDATTGSLEELSKRRKLSGDDIPKDFTLKVHNWVSHNKSTLYAESSFPELFH